MIVIMKATLLSVVVLSLGASLIVSPQDSLAAPVSISRKPKVDHGLNCTSHLQTIDRCSSMGTYSYLTPFNQYPNNTIELKGSCDRIVDGLKCVKTYSKCINGLARRSLTSFTTSRSRHSKRICANVNDAKSQEFINAHVCIYKSNKLNQMIDSEKELIRSIQYLTEAKTMKWEDRFHGACCSALAYKSKVLKEIEPECGKHKDTHEDMVNSMIGELLDSACPESNKLTTEICPKLAKLLITKEFKPISLTSAGLDLIVALAEENPKEKQ